MTNGPIRTGSLLRRSTSRPRKAFQPRLAALPRCLDTASTTDVSRHEHPRSTPLLETSCLAPWENPPELDSQGRNWDGRFRHFAQARAEPPCGHSASNGFVLGRHAAGFGSTGHHVWCRSTFRGGERHRFFGGWRLGLIEPSGTSRGDRAERKAPGCLSSEPVSTGARQCDRPLRAPRCLPSSETRASALSRFVGRASFAGRRIRRCTCSSMFENFD